LRADEKRGKGDEKEEKKKWMCQNSSFLKERKNSGCAKTTTDIQSER
jgi:hypothetical protein